MSNIFEVFFCEEIEKLKGGNLWTDGIHITFKAGITLDKSHIGFLIGHAMANAYAMYISADEDGRITVSFHLED